MKLKQRASEYKLYRYRFLIGYTVALLSVAVMLVSAALYAPQGIRAEEQASSLQSGSLEFATFDPSSVVHLPYHSLQLASFVMFGVSEISIKLPSVLLGITAAIGMFLLIRLWMRSNVAVIAALIGATTPAFIFASQDGTPIIFSIAVSIWLLLSATYVARRHKQVLTWKILLFTFFVLALYTPLGIYLCLALVMAAVLHPHLRYVIKRLDPNRIATSAALALVLLSPLLYSIAMQPTIALELLGIPESMPDWWPQAISIAGMLLGFGTPTSGILRPVISFGVGLLMLVGLYRLARTRYTARSFVSIVWLILLLPFVYLNPDYVLMIVPLVVILVAMGMTTLIIEWYRLFPRNPYARIFGLLPISFIVAGIVLSSASRYSVSYRASPELAKSFHTDLSLLSGTLNRAEADADAPIPVVVGEQNKDFYELAAKYDHRYSVVTNPPEASDYIVIAGSGSEPTKGSEPAHIAVTARHNEANRVYLYTQE